MKHPTWSILNPAKRYYSSADTNIKRTFARVKREQQTEAHKVVQIKQQRRGK